MSNIQWLIDTLRFDPDSGLRCEAAQLLGDLGATEAMPALREALTDRRIQSTAEAALRRIREAGRAPQASANVLAEDDEDPWGGNDSLGG